LHRNGRFLMTRPPLFRRYPEMGCGFGRIDADPVAPGADPLRRQGQKES
jgi:hypothetical protein